MVVFKERIILESKAKVPRRKSVCSEKMYKYRVTKRDAQRKADVVICEMALRGHRH